MLDRRLVAVVGMVERSELSDERRAATVELALAMRAEAEADAAEPVMLPEETAEARLEPSLLTPDTADETAELTSDAPPLMALPTALVTALPGLATALVAWPTRDDASLMT